MKRRNFLKIFGCAVAAPSSVLAVGQSPGHRTWNRDVDLAEIYPKHTVGLNRVPKTFIGAVGGDFDGAMGGKHYLHKFNQRATRIVNAEPGHVSVLPEPNLTPYRKVTEIVEFSLVAPPGMQPSQAQRENDVREALTQAIRRLADEMMTAHPPHTKKHVSDQSYVFDNDIEFMYPHRMRAFKISKTSTPKPWMGS